MTLSLKPDTVTGGASVNSHIGKPAMTLSLKPDTVTGGASVNSHIGKPAMILSLVVLVLTHILGSLL